METFFEYVPAIAGIAIFALVLLVVHLRDDTRKVVNGMKKESVALANANVRVHSIRPTDPPADLTEDEKAVERRYYDVEVTIEPPLSTTPVRWKPRGLDTTDPDSDPQAFEEPCELFGVEVWEGGRFVPAEWTGENEVEGAQRVKLCVGAFPQARRFTIDYRLQNLAVVSLP